VDELAHDILLDDFCEPNVELVCDVRIRKNLLCIDTIEHRDETLFRRNHRYVAGHPIDNRDLSSDFAWTVQTNRNLVTVLCEHTGPKLSRKLQYQR
jgi:hypothetical protein